MNTSTQITYPCFTNDIAGYSREFLMAHMCFYSPGGFSLTGIRVRRWVSLQNEWEVWGLTPEGGVIPFFADCFY